MSRRSPEQVHDEDGHTEFVASCKRCQTEAEQDRNAEAARAELATGGVVSDGGTYTVETFADGQAPDGPLPPAESADGPDDESVELPVELEADEPRMVDGRPACYLVDKCGLPEFAEGTGLCGAHWSTRPDLRKVARRG